MGGPLGWDHEVPILPQAHLQASMESGRLRVCVELGWWAALSPCSAYRSGFFMECNNVDAPSRISHLCIFCILYLTFVLYSVLLHSGMVFLDCFGFFSWPESGWPESGGHCLLLLFWLHVTTLDLVSLYIYQCCARIPYCPRLAHDILAPLLYQSGWGFSASSDITYLHKSNITYLG